MESKVTDLISIVIPIYNCAAFLKRTIRSVQAQDHTHWEILASIDAVCDHRSIQIIEEMAFQDSRIQIIQTPDRGPAKVRNAGIRAARGRYLCFLDADDYWLPTKLSVQLEWMKSKGEVFTATGYRRFRAGATPGRLMGLQDSRLSFGRLLRQNNILCSSVMLDLEGTGKMQFPEAGCEDFALWLGLMRKGIECAVVPHDLVRYRVSPESYGASKWKTAQESWEILRKNAGFTGAAVLFPQFLARGILKHGRF